MGGEFSLERNVYMYVALFNNDSDAIVLTYKPTVGIDNRQYLNCVLICKIKCVG